MPAPQTLTEAQYGPLMKAQADEHARLDAYLATIKVHRVDARTRRIPEAA